MRRLLPVMLGSFAFASALMAFECASVPARAAEPPIPVLETPAPVQTAVAGPTPVGQHLGPFQRHLTIAPQGTTMTVSGLGAFALARADFETLRGIVTGAYTESQTEATVEVPASAAGPLVKAATARANFKSVKIQTPSETYAIVNATIANDGTASNDPRAFVLRFEHITETFAKGSSDGASGSAGKLVISRADGGSATTIPLDAIALDVDDPVDVNSGLVSAHTKIKLAITVSDASPSLILIAGAKDGSTIRNASIVSGKQTFRFQNLVIGKSIDSVGSSGAGSTRYDLTAESLTVITHARSGTSTFAVLKGASLDTKTSTLASGEIARGKGLPAPYFAIEAGATIPIASETFSQHTTHVVGSENQHGGRTTVKAALSFSDGDGSPLLADIFVNTNIRKASLVTSAAKYALHDVHLTSFHEKIAAGGSLTQSAEMVVGSYDIDLEAGSSSGSGGPLTATFSLGTTTSTAASNAVALDTSSIEMERPIDPATGQSSGLVRNKATIVLPGAGEPLASSGSAQKIEIAFPGWHLVLHDVVVNSSAQKSTASADATSFDVTFKQIDVTKSGTEIRAFVAKSGPNIELETGHGFALADPIPIPPSGTNELHHTPDALTFAFADAMSLGDLVTDFGERKSLGPVITMSSKSTYRLTDAAVERLRIDLSREGAATLRARLSYRSASFQK